MNRKPPSNVAYFQLMNPSARRRPLFLLLQSISWDKLAMNLWVRKTKLAAAEALDQACNDLQIVLYHRWRIDQGRLDHEPIRHKGEGLHTETMNEVTARLLPKTVEEEGRLIKTIIESSQAALGQMKRELTPEDFQRAVDDALLRAWAKDEANHVEVLEEQRQCGNPYPPLPSDPPVTMRPPDALWLYRIARFFSLSSALLYLIRRYAESETELRQGIVQPYEVLEARHTEVLAKEASPQKPEEKPPGTASETPPASTAQAKDSKATKRKPLTKRTRIIYEKLCSLEPHQAMMLPEIQRWYENEAELPDDVSPNLDDGTWKRIRRELIPYGLYNHQNIGYCIKKE